MFEVEAVSLGRVTHCIVGHDGDGIGEGWYLNEILVREGPDATHEYVFPCCRSVIIAITYIADYTEFIHYRSWNFEPRQKS